MPEVGVFLIADDGGAHVANIVPGDRPQLTEEEYNDALSGFAAFVRAATEDLGGRVVVDVAPFNANRTTGMAHPSGAERFDEFPVRVLGIGGRPSAIDLARGLEADGWPEYTASEVAIEYEQGLRLLDHAAGR